MLTGGHTTEGAELALGFAVTGFAEEGMLFEKSRLQPGDRLILTKPLGSGALLAAWMRGECRAAWFETLKASMLLANGKAAEVFRKAGVAACTDVTGFGLAGHLLEMLDASRVSARLDGNEVRLYPGFTEVVAQGSSARCIATTRGWRAGCREKPPRGCSIRRRPAVCSGRSRRRQSRDTLEKLRQAGYHDAVVIGEVIPLEKENPPMILVAERKG